MRRKQTTSRHFDDGKVVIGLEELSAGDRPQKTIRPMLRIGAKQVPGTPA
jgi:hypothetical protein